MENRTSPVGVFLSYNHVDAQVALEIRRCLQLLSDRLKIFLDHATLTGGDEYENRIAAAIQQSSWFIFVAIGEIAAKDMTWSFYEAGQFRAKLLGGSATREDVTDRMCVLFDGDAPPKPTSKYQSTKISVLDANSRKIELDRSKPTFNETQLESTPIYSLLRTIVQRSDDTPLRDLADPGILSLLRECSRAITEAVVKSRTDQRLPEVSLQPRISFLLPPAQAEEGFSSIDNATSVVGYDNALPAIFQIAGSKTTWGEFKSAAKLENGAIPLWLDDIERAVCKQIALGLVPSQTDMMCVSSGGMYRPVITRYVPFQSGAREVYVIFSPIQRRPLVGPGARRGSFGIAEKIGMLLLNLMMAVRFRQRVLPLIETIESEALEASGTLLRIEREIGSIEAEAQEYGFAISGDAIDAQQSSIIDLISDESDKRTARKFLEDYVSIRTAIVRSVQDVRNAGTPTLAKDVRAQIAQGLQRLQEMNGPYISLLVKELVRQESAILH